MPSMIRGPSARPQPTARPSLSPPGPPLPAFGPASGLLSQPGCPACRYAAAAGRDYLTWLFDDGCEDAGDAGTGRASRELCARHTRGLPDVVATPVGCPACEHEDAAARHVIQVLLEVVTPGDRKSYKLHGGLCLPHLRRAVLAHRKLDTSWLVRFMLARLSGPAADLDLLAGWSAPDAEPLADRAAGPQDGLAPDAAAAGYCLCADHLRAGVAAGGDAAAALLAGQARLQAQHLARVLAGRPRQRLGNFLPVRARQALANPACPACRDAEAGTGRESS